MKETTPRNLSVALVAALLCLIAFYLYSTAATTRKNAASSFKDSAPRLECLNGASEFHFVPAGDNRVWHVVNNYYSIGSGRVPGHNMSSYTFSKDSVYVINEFAGIPDTPQWDINIAGLSFTGNNFFKQN